jgi:hypothetical protein
MRSFFERNTLRSAPVVRLIAQATTDVDLVSVTAVNGVLHALGRRRSSQ